MLKSFNSRIAVAVVLTTFAASLAPLSAQTSSKTQPTSAASVEHAIDLAGKGQCQEALPVLQRSTSHLADKELKYRAALATARCAMSLNQSETVAQTLFLLNREFRHDPEVLYITIHYYSELASRASQELAQTAPDSYQAQELEAEAMESQEKWPEAIEEYRKILERNPNLPGIHYRLGRIFLSQSDSPASSENARKELEEELKIDPSNASAEFLLGEMARRTGKWEEAIPHFSRASKLDPGFSEAFLALGMSLNSAGRFADAIASLENYVKMLPEDPAGHYQLAIAYRRMGRNEDAMRETNLQEKVSSRSGQSAPDHAVPH